MTAGVRSIAAQRDKGQRVRDNQLLDAVEQVQRGLAEPPTTAARKQANQRR